MISDIELKLKKRILNVENPTRYFPSEYLYGKHDYKENDLKCAICFPDLYEIGMSNNAVRILYDLMNKKNNVFCDRVFAVAPDFEQVLRETDTPLFTIEKQFPLNQLDFLGISIGYELLATNILQILDLGKIPLRTVNRSDSDPIVIAGGPASTNPVPFGPFVDFVYIGEAENGLNDVLDILQKYKSRRERIEHLKNLPFLWYENKTEKTYRAVDSTFGTEYENAKLKYYVVPSFQVAQDHGTVEIMRGCPNGCRFCHAGQYYKPFRQRNMSCIYDMVAQSVNDFGYREVTLSSLSSGDYPDLDVLIKQLNGDFAKKRISFSLPSLKVSSFSLDILEQISEVRKSGLTFAIETPDIINQRSMNKEVPVETVIDIINEAKTRGWKLAKFYFMVGLPFVDMETEQEKIVGFLSKIRTATKINMNINIGTFIPKAHTPFQRVRQLTIEESSEHLKGIKKALMAAIPGIKVSYHEPSISFLEGVISRGDEKCADLIEKAYSLGCRLDAWDEYINYELWNQALNDCNYDVNKRSFEPDEKLPWDNISMNVSEKYLSNEYEKASKSELTSVCNSECSHNCGVCGKKNAVKKAVNDSESITERVIYKDHDVSEYQQVIIEYTKSGRAVYNSHIAVLRQFEMAFQRAGLDIAMTQGFNPKPRMEFVNPISMGVIGNKELMLCELPESEINDSLISLLNNNLSEGFTVNGYKMVRIPESGKKISLASHLVKSEFEISDIHDSAIKDVLDSRINDNSSDYKVLSDNNVYKITMKSEKNIFKTLFPEEMNKFYVAGNCTVIRTDIVLENL